MLCGEFRFHVAQRRSNQAVDLTNDGLFYRETNLYRHRRSVCRTRHFTPVAAVVNQLQNVIRSRGKVTVQVHAGTVKNGQVRLENECYFAPCPVVVQIAEASRTGDGEGIAVHRKDKRICGGNCVYKPTAVGCSRVEAVVMLVDRAANGDRKSVV